MVGSKSIWCLQTYTQPYFTLAAFLLSQYNKDGLYIEKVKTTKIAFAIRWVEPPSHVTIKNFQADRIKDRSVAKMHSNIYAGRVRCRCVERPVQF